MRLSTWGVDFRSFQFIESHRRISFKRSTYLIDLLRRRKQIIFGIINTFCEILRGHQTVLLTRFLCLKIHCLGLFGQFILDLSWLFFSTWTFFLLIFRFNFDIYALISVVWWTIAATTAQLYLALRVIIRSITLSRSTAYHTSLSVFNWFIGGFNQILVIFLWAWLGGIATSKLVHPFIWCGIFNMLFFASDIWAYFWLIFVFFGRLVFLFFLSLFLLYFAPVVSNFDLSICMHFDPYLIEKIMVVVQSHFDVYMLILSCNYKASEILLNHFTGSVFSVILDQKKKGSHSVGFPLALNSWCRSVCFSTIKIASDLWLDFISCAEVHSNVNF